MKLMIASDIHGSALYCRQLLEAFDREGADRLLLLGDILYHGPRNDLPPEDAPKEVLALLNARKDEILCVRGNCDCEVDQMVLEFPVLAEYALLAMDKTLVFVTHGHNFNENGGDMEIDYVTDLGHAFVMKNKFRISVKEMEKKTNG